MKGVYTAIITPFKEDGKIDFEAFGKLLEKQESWYKHSLVIRDFEDIKAIYGNEGYPFVEIYPQRTLDDEKQIIDMNFVVRKGNKCHIEQIDISGNERSRDKVIRREIVLYAGLRVL